MATRSPSDPPPVEPLLSVADIQRRYPGLGERAARSRMRRIGAIEIGRALFVRPDDVVAFDAAEAAASRASHAAAKSDEAPIPRRGHWIERAA